MAKKKNRGQCVYMPEISGEPSEMFSGLIDMHIERPLVNYIYAKYHASNIGALMDAAGYARNSQNEHNAADVYKYLKVDDIQKAQGFSLERIENKYGIVDRNGERTHYSPMDAYRKAKEINENEVGHVAKVVKMGDYFTVIADKKDSRTQSWIKETEKALTVFQSFKNSFIGTPIDFDALQAAFPELVNPMDIEGFLTYMNSLRSADISLLRERDIKMLLYTGAGSPRLEALKTRGWGDYDAIAAQAYDILNNPANYAADVVSLVKNALTDARKANDDAFNNAKAKKTQSEGAYTSESDEIEKALKRLDDQYEINHTIILRTDKEIRRLSDAAAEAILTLQRQLRYLQRQEGRIGEGLKVEETLDELVKDITGQRYYIGLLKFLGEANRYSTTISNLLRNVPDTGTAMERSFAMGRALSKAVSFRDGYNVIVQALRNPEALLIDENMTAQQLEDLKSIAESIASMMDRQKQDIAAMQQDLTLTVSQEILGSDVVNGIPLAQIVQMGIADSSIMDFLYSCERVSDPIVASLGTVIRDAQRKRDRIASEFAARIEQANRLLRDGDKNSTDKFRRKHAGDTHLMYDAVEEKGIDWKGFNEAREEEKKRLSKEGLVGTAFSDALNAWWIANTEEAENGRRLPNKRWRVEKTKYYVRSNYDWAAYNKAKNKAEALLRKSGLTGFEFNDEMEKWERENTIEKVVDEKSGRTERVPSKDYWLFKTEEEFLESLGPSHVREYYLTMMQIKGEIGTLLPSYAQKQYLPPQRRASWIDIVTEGKRRGLDAKGVAKNILDRMNFLKQREDDTSFVEGGLIGERNAVKSYSSYDDTLLKQVPIYYINPLRDQSDLLMDFSGAVEGLGAVAANYAVLNGCGERTAGANDSITGVKEVVENMADYLKYRPIADFNSDGKKRIDIAKWKEAIVGKVLRRHSDRTLTSFMIDGFVNKHIYNQQLALGTEGSVLRKLQLLIRGLLGYTSVAALSVNVKGAVSNWLVGEYQMLFEGLSGSMRGGFRKKNRDKAEYYTFADYARADGIMFGQGVKLGTVMDHLANTTGTLGHLLERKFDPLQEVYTDLGEKRYFSGVKKLIGGFNWMGMYSVGESLIHLHNMYSVLCHEKVKLNGKEVSLYDVFDKEYTEDGKNAKLIIKDGATTLDGSAITDEYLEKVQAKIRMINQKTHGSMNTEDKGMIHMAMAGRAAMQFKQWMVEHYSRRFRGRYFDGTTRTWQEGYYNTVYKLMKSWVSDLLKTNIEATARWNQLDNTQKNNVTRAISELVCFAGLLGIAAALGDPKEHKGERLYRFLIYQIRRLIMDEEASMPVTPLLIAAGIAYGGEKTAQMLGADIEASFNTSGGMYKEGITMAQTPFAITKTIQGLLYPITGLGEAADVYQKGRNKGKNKYWTKIKKNTIPFYGQIDQLLHMDTEDYIFNVFDNIAYNKGK